MSNHVLYWLNALQLKLKWLKYEERQEFEQAWWCFDHFFFQENIEKVCEIGLTCSRNSNSTNTYFPCKFQTFTSETAFTWWLHFNLLTCKKPSHTLTCVHTYPQISMWGFEHTNYIGSEFSGAFCSSSKSIPWVICHADKQASQLLILLDG